MLSSESPLLVATDLSQTGHIVLEKAFKLAQKYQKFLYILHVAEMTFFAPKTIELSQIEARLTDSLQSFFERYKDVKAKLICERGEIAKVTAETIEKLQASLLIIGTSGEDHFLREFFLGSHCMKIVRASQVPVLVVKTEDEPDYSMIFLPTDFSEASQKISAMTLKLFPHALVLLFHVILKPFEQRLGMYGLDRQEILNYHKEIDEKSTKDADNFIKGLGLAADKERTRLIMESGVFSAELCLKKARENKSNLIALSTTGNISFFALDILNQSRNDVLVFKPRK